MHIKIDGEVVSEFQKTILQKILTAYGTAIEAYLHGKSKNNVAKVEIKL